MKADYWFRSIREINAAVKAGLITKKQAAELLAEVEQAGRKEKGDARSKRKNAD